MKYITGGQTCLQEALSINANYAEAYALEGVLLQLRSKITKNKTSRLAGEAEARNSLQKAIHINQNLKFLFTPFLEK